MKQVQVYDINQYFVNYFRGADPNQRSSVTYLNYADALVKYKELQYNFPDIHKIRILHQIVKMWECHEETK